MKGLLICVIFILAINLNISANSDTSIVKKKDVSALEKSIGSSMNLKDSLALDRAIKATIKKMRDRKLIVADKHL